MKRLELTGRVFTRLTVVGPAERPTWAAKETWWECHCECGATIRVKGHDLTTGNTKSCGCWKMDILRQVSTTHGGRHTVEYVRWMRMITRCENPNQADFKNYGARGIIVCPEWRHDFAQFLKDMGPCPPDHTLDRIDNNGNYGPLNCRWATKVQQARNTRASAFIEWQGERLTKAEWAERLGITQAGVWMRWHRHHSLAERPRKRRHPEILHPSS